MINTIIASAYRSPYGDIDVLKETMYNALSIATANFHESRITPTTNIGLTSQILFVIESRVEHLLHNISSLYRRARGRREFRRFHNRVKEESKQMQGESLEDFIIELKKKASRCKLEGLQDSLIVTMITCGIRNEAIRQRLLEDDTLTLEKAVELCQVIESAKVRSQAMGQGNTRKAEMGQGNTRKAEIDMVHKKTGHNSTKNIIKNCSKCGKKEHDINKCPAFGKICHYCKIQNHFATVCFKKKKATTSEKNKKVSEVKEAVVDNNTDSFLYVGSVTDKNVISHNDQWWTHLEINNQIVRFREIFETEGTDTYIDDLLVWGSTREQHDERLKKVLDLAKKHNVKFNLKKLKKVLDLAKKHNVKFNLKKCKFGQSQVKYMGHIISPEGVAPDESKIKAKNPILKLNNAQELIEEDFMAQYSS
ncbi:hypothetical protein QE152_g21679 [Popillia japonica]|uniref:Polyprotein n=1 Tax=Popillia japonica TaxID=7064 RepID=A0AAW1KNM7_POPJA